MKNILGYKISKRNLKNTVEFISNLCDIQATELTHVVTLNPEMIVECESNPKLKEIVQSADLLTADGNGIVWACKKIGSPVPERVTGVDLVKKLFKKREMEHKLLKVYLVGGTEDTIKKTFKKIEDTYQFVKVVGYVDGYFSPQQEKKLIIEINNSQPDALLVGMGSPRQEEFIYNYKHMLNTKVAIGVGGTFDILAGNVNRAPEVIRDMKLEFLYRLAQQPSRLPRQMKIVKFVTMVKKAVREQRRHNRH